MLTEALDLLKVYISSKVAFIIIKRVGYRVHNGNVKMYLNGFFEIMAFPLSLGKMFLQSSQLFFCKTPGNVTLPYFMLKGNVQCVTLSCQDPVSANGRIIRFDIKIQNQKDKVKNGSLDWERIPVNRSEADSSSNQREITFLKEIHLADKKFVKVYVTASNSMGKSAPAFLAIPEKTHGRYPR